MPRSCSAINCRKLQGDESRHEGDKLSFHKFPLHDKKLLRSWILVSKRAGNNKAKLFQPTVHTLLCSDHFEVKDFCPYVNGERKRLLETSIPSWFATIGEEKKPGRKAPAKRVASPHTTDEPKRVRSESDDVHVAEGIELDHSYNQSAANRHVTSPLKKLHTKLRHERYEKKKLRQKLQRRDKRLQCLKSTLDAIKESKAADADLIEEIRNRFENPVVSQLFTNEVINGDRKRRGRRFSEEIKKLCLTLHYYSPRAYKFLAKNLTLPSLTSIRDWTRSVGCEVGILQEVLQTLSSQVTCKKIDPNCCLLVDEMSIRKAQVYSRSKDKFVGYVDLGAGELEETRLATNALVFMAVGLKGQWRHPVAYFLTDHLSSETQAELARTVLCALSDAGLKVRTFVADGLQANLAMFTHLGVKTMQSKQFQLPVADNYFHHPATNDKVYVMLDVVHMLKLMRNLLGERTLKLDDEVISWDYIKALYELQNSEGIRAANKLSRLHIQYSKNKMKVKLAAQVFSCSVGKALQYLTESGHPKFVGAGPTASFILLMDKGFDYLNCSSPFGRGYKAPTTAANLAFRREFLVEFSSALMRLQTTTGEPIMQTRRFTPILGLCLASQTVMDVSELLLEEGFRYILSYKMSQDHVELLFGRIRRMGGLNNNPNVVQFQHAMRRLTLHNFIAPSAAGNCTVLEDDDAGGLLEIRRAKPDPSTFGDMVEMPVAVQYALSVENTRSAFVDDCLCYIAGYVCRKLVEARTVACGECVGALLCNEDDPPPPEVMRLIKVRDNGGLMVPSASAYAVIASAEQHLSAMRKCGEVQRPRLALTIQCGVLAQCMDRSDRGLFPGAAVHMYDSRGDESHAVVLVKQIVARYLRVRLYAYGQTATLGGLRSAHKRHNLYKQVLFANQ